MADPRGPTDPMAVLSRALTDLTNRLDALRADVQADARARVRKQHTIMAVLAVLAAAVGLVGFVSVQNNRIARDTRTTNTRIVDCTTPGGGCYRDRQRRTGDAVGDIVKASVFVAECSRLRPGDSGPVFDAALEQCVAAKLSSHRPSTPVPTPAPAPSPTR
jgi:hypothetical protein